MATCLLLPSSLLGIGCAVTGSRLRHWQLCQSVCLRARLLICEPCPLMTLNDYAYGLHGDCVYGCCWWWKGLQVRRREATGQLESCVL